MNFARRFFTTALLMLAAPTAFAADCIFGETTASLDETVAANLNHFAALGLNLTKAKSPKQVSEINPFERGLVAQTLIDEAMNMGVDVPYETEVEALEAFVKEDGYFQTITGEFGKHDGFLVVAHYPGDNEYGRIYGLKISPNGELRGHQVATIGDGEIGRCKVTN